MQERVNGSALRHEVALQMPLGRFDNGLVFGMQRDKTDGSFLEALDRRARAILCPCIDEETTHLVARRREHRSGRLGF